MRSPCKGFSRTGLPSSTSRASSRVRSMPPRTGRYAASTISTRPTPRPAASRPAWSTGSRSRPELDMSWLLAFLGFVALIILHEFGHFIAAKKTGMRVERFSLFFPPLIVRKRVGETEYAIGATPLGGYVKITGMNPEEEFPPDVAPRAYYNQPVWKRVVVILAGPAMNLLIAFVILFGLAFGAQKVTAVVDKVRPATPAAVPATLEVRRNGQTLPVRVRPRYNAADQRMEIGFFYGTRPLNPSVPSAA